MEYLEVRSRAPNLVCGPSDFWEKVGFDIKL